MKPRAFDPLHLDVEAFAKESAELRGEWPLTSFDRLVDAAHPEAKPGDAEFAAWTAKGESRPMRGGAPQVWLHIGAAASLSLVCQRCLGPVRTPLDAERSFMFAPDESTAAELDADLEDDVMALTRSLDLHSLIEDELLLALPLVPRHNLCPEPLPLSDDDEAMPRRTNPFAALSVLKRNGPPG